MKIGKHELHKLHEVAVTKTLKN